jgi:hypothetical protein
MRVILTAMRVIITLLSCDIHTHACDFDTLRVIYVSLSYEYMHTARMRVQSTLRTAL